MSAAVSPVLAPALSSFVDTVVARDPVSAGLVRRADVIGPAAFVEIELGFPAYTYAPVYKAALAAHLRAATGLDLHLDVRWAVQPHAVQRNLRPLPHIRNVIAVASGKGGVGKSTVAINFALALRAMGAHVGLLDADIYGPSQPRMLGSSERPTSPDGKIMNPIFAHGLQAMSIGFLIDESQPTIWRGPMVTSALMQLLTETRWDNLDYLVVDMPPGTGDIALTLSQRIPLSGAVVVTTPQDIALIDARKGLEMFKKVEVPVLGVVENMSVFCCPNCGHQTAIFGEGGGDRLARETGVEVLGRLPLDARIRELADNGNPIVVAEPDSAAARTYRDIALRATARLAHAEVQAFPSIEVSDD
jgi:ATP-binding protein involved in chromosome partitioning